MAMRTFPALGFDPAPGSPSALLGQAREADRAARALAGAAVAAGRLDARWRGAAAEAARDHTRELPGDLGRAAAAHGTLARELAAYADDLAARQLRAADLEDRAAALRARAGGLGVSRQAAPVGAGSAVPAHRWPARPPGGRRPDRAAPAPGGGPRTTVAMRLPRPRGRLLPSSTRWSPKLAGCSATTAPTLPAPRPASVPPRPTRHTGSPACWSGSATGHTTGSPPTPRCSRRSPAVSGWRRWCSARPAWCPASSSSPRSRSPSAPAPSPSTRASPGPPGAVPGRAWSPTPP